ncbi:MAG: b(o/a)3-type cytochrome-c oxidase subunit 1 [Chloroflexus sp.]|uniref:b(o/a)3-type cytochrome-c oxidase subunit 1 n=1 Tax=Chloroflexus sp. TaxID=1904827 RepID=UPI00404B1D0A
MASIAARARPLAISADLSDERKLAGINIFIAFAALAVGGLMGVLQILRYNGLDLYTPIKPVLPGGYYQGLTVHGVLNVLVFTTFYIIGFLTYIFAKALNRPLANSRLAWATLWVMGAGLLLAAIPLLTNNATVMFTFYPPLKADALFYIGLTLVVAGTWLLLVNMILTRNAWLADNPGQRTPLPAFMAIVTMLMWTIATIGVAGEMIFLVIPWSLGLVGGTDPVLARTLFWFTGHPIVYFWLLPAYISWYTLVPEQAGGKLFSDPMARVSFILFLILSIPIGMHHQVADPGISEIWKLVHAVFTFGVFFPSLLTFFNVVASLEYAGRRNGGEGWLAWIFNLPWGKPEISAQIVAMMLFAFGGIGGLVNASYNINLVVHNTSWISGHFHLTVGTAVALSFMGITYWLVPHLTGRALWSKSLGVAQAWLWFVGMGLFSHFMHELGLRGMPRRTDIGGAPYVQDEWRFFLFFAMIGGLIMFVSAIFYYLNMIMTLTRGKKLAEVPDITFARALSGPEDAPKILDRLLVWVTVAAVLILINYLPTIIDILSTATFDIPGRRVW